MPYYYLKTLDNLDLCATAADRASVTRHGAGSSAGSLSLSL
jgi:hypothetical protein